MSKSNIYLELLDKSSISLIALFIIISNTHAFICDVAMCCVKFFTKISYNYIKNKTVNIFNFTKNLIMGNNI